MINLNIIVWGKYLSFTQTNFFLRKLNLQKRIRILNIINQEYHTPALLNESIDVLVNNPNGVYIDATFGGGGHSLKILEKITALKVDKRVSQGKLIAMDQDSDVIQNQTFTEIKNKFGEIFTFLNTNFSNLKQELKKLEIESVDGIFADLGISSHQIDQAERGFSYRFDARLDMRMDTDLLISAYEVINEYSKDALAKILKEYGELSGSNNIAYTLIEHRPIKTTFELNYALKKFTPKHAEAKFLSKVYQAIRIEVNQELKVLENLLLDGSKILKSGGVFAIITYHSLEDRLVKRFFKTGNLEGNITKDFFGNILTPFSENGMILPSENEILFNNRARSAKLRFMKLK